MFRRKESSKAHEETCIAFDEFTKTIEDLCVKDVMSRRHWDLPIIEKNEDISHVLIIIGARDHVWVVDSKENKKLCGVITVHDILDFLVPRSSHTFISHIGRRAMRHTSEKASDIMTAHPVVIHENAKIKDAIKTMALHRIRRLPIVEKGKLAGEITLRQIINMAAQLEKIKKRRK